MKEVTLKTLAIDECLNFGVSARLLVSKLIARESQNAQTVLLAGKLNLKPIRQAFCRFILLHQNKVC